MTSEALFKHESSGQQTPRLLQKVIAMPIGANIPREWIVEEDQFRIVVVVPSWSVEGGSYRVSMDTEDRELACSCQGFRFRGECHHISYLINFCYKPSHPRGVQSTSLKALRSLSPDMLGHCERLVYDTLRESPLNDRMISKFTGLRINNVTARRNKLWKVGLVEEAGSAVDPETNMTTKFWRAI